jgi:hypothetical protein
MSYYLRVFCQSSELLPSSAITDFIKDGCFFEIIPSFEINQDDDSLVKEWRSIVIHYQPQKRPIVIERNINDALLRAEINELIDTLKMVKSENHLTSIIDQVTNSQQIIVIDVDPLGLTESGWEMVDCLEAFLASHLSGLVYAPESGVFDAQLQPLYKFTTQFISNNEIPSLLSV